MVFIFQIVHHGKLGLPAVHSENPPDLREWIEHGEPGGSDKSLVNLHDTGELQERLNELRHIMGSRSSKQIVMLTYRVFAYSLRNERLGALQEQYQTQMESP